jgi:hypothetical protein
LLSCTTLPLEQAGAYKGVVWSFFSIILVISHLN